MIRRFRHRGLRRLYEDDDRREVNPQQHADKIARVLARLDVATQAEQLDIPGFRLHRLRGEFAGYWSITVSANCGSSSALRRAMPRTWIWWITTSDQEA